MSDIDQRLQHLGQIIFKRDGRLPVIKRGSDQWSEWLQWRIKHGLSVKFMDTREIWTVPMEYPPINLKAAVMAAMGKSANDAERS